MNASERFHSMRRFEPVDRPFFVGGGYDAGFVPAFKEEVFEETDEYRILRTTYGSVIKEFKGGESAIPRFLEFPVKDMQTFEDIRWRLDPATSEGLGNWHQTANLYDESDVPVYLYICGLFGQASPRLRETDVCLLRFVRVDPCHR